MIKWPKVLSFEKIPVLIHQALTVAADFDPSMEALPRQRTAPMPQSVPLTRDHFAV